MSSVTCGGYDAIPCQHGSGGEASLGSEWKVDIWKVEVENYHHMVEGRKNENLLLSSATLYAIPLPTTAILNRQVN